MQSPSQPGQGGQNGQQQMLFDQMPQFEVDLSSNQYMNVNQPQQQKTQGVSQNYDIEYRRNKLKEAWNSKFEVITRRHMAV